MQQIHGDLQSGEIIAYPTDTIYGLGVDVNNAAAAQKLFDLKKRNSDNPVSVLYPNIENLLNHFPNLNRFQRNLVQKLLPGQITLLLPVPSSSQILPYFKKDGFSGARIIKHHAINNILNQYPNPISTTSINPSGLKPANTVANILNYFPDKISLILDDQKRHKIIPSTILKVEETKYSVIRKGSVPISAIENLI